jgi:hypothetical protein
MRDLMRKTCFIFALGLCACGYGALLTYQAQQYADLDEHDLTVDAGMESGAFISLLKHANATNIIHSKGYWHDKVISAITADFMDYIYFFEDDKYVGRKKIRYDQGHPQVHPFIKIVHLGGRYGAFLLAENLEIDKERAAEIILMSDDQSSDYIIIKLGKKIGEHGGMYDPFVGGENLAEGVFFAARDRAGDVWPLAYKISFSGQEPRVDRVLLSEAARCSCFEKWMMGADAREVFDMVVY